MRVAFALLGVALILVPRIVAQEPARPDAGSASPDPESETLALGFVREHQPELAALVESLKPMNPGQYRKAIGELAAVARSLAATRTRNPKRYAVALDDWKARSRVELLAARLAASPAEEKVEELRRAIEAKLDAEAARHRLEIEQAEAAAKRARAALDRLQDHRDEIVANRLRSLRPKKARPETHPKPRPEASPTPAAGPADTTPGTNRP